MTTHVALASLADQLQMDRSHLRRYVLHHGFTPVRIRTDRSRQQLTLALTADEAEQVRALRDRDGFASNKPVVNGTVGVCYVIRLIPEYDQRRLKLGFAQDLAARLASHRCSAPTAELVRSWPCARAWEPCAITCLANGCRHLAGEVYECEDVPALLSRGDAFFALMPRPQ